MGSWWLGLWSIVGAVWNMVLDVAQFWRDVSVALQSHPGYLVCGERSEPEMAKTKDPQDTTSEVVFGLILS